MVLLLRIYNCAVASAPPKSGKLACSARHIVRDRGTGEQFSGRLVFVGFVCSLVRWFAKLACLLALSLVQRSFVCSLARSRFLSALGIRSGSQWRQQNAFESPLVRPSLCWLAERWDLSGAQTRDARAQNSRTCCALIRGLPAAQLQAALCQTRYRSKPRTLA